MTESLPIIRAETHTADGGVRLHLSVSADINLFAGHFPGFPLLPGVAQIHWAAQLGAERFSIDSRFSRLLNIKFQKPVLPDSELELLLKWDAARRQLSFTYDSAAGCHASGKIEYAAANLDGGA
jgi:3-hydroxymyristoyl/3-hydroxydecanoyl-(acyl carrier protein) dehydratase